MSKKISSIPAFLKESFLSNYLFADVMFSRFLHTDGAKVIYEQYASVFGIDDPEWLKTMWEIISSPFFSKADTSATFNTLARLSQLYPGKFSSNELYLLAIKSAAMQIKEEIMAASQDTTLNATKSMIEAKAQSGDTDCIALIAFLTYHGFLFKKNTEQALKYIHNGACWNQFFCALMGAQYEADPRPYHETICAVLAEPSQLESLNYLRNYLHISPDTKPKKISVEIEKAFQRGSFQRCKLQPDILKMMASCVMSDNTKCTILKKSTDKDMVPSDIPLELDRATDLTYDLSGFRIFSESREDEYERIAANIAVSDIRASADYRPLLIVCQDKAAFELYHAAISECFKSSPFSVVNFAAIGNLSLAPYKDNTLISAMEKLRDRNSVLLLEHCETLSEENAIFLSKFLSGSSRRSFKLNCSPQISLDLSGMLPIILTPLMPCKEICSQCETIIASNMYSDEYNHLIDKALTDKKELFRLRSLKISNDAIAFLSEYSFETASILLDKVIGEVRTRTNDVAITIDELQKVVNTYYITKKQNYSFWGDPHNDK